MKRKQILGACGLPKTQSNVEDVVHPLEHSIIDMDARGRRCWLVNGKDMYAFLEATKKILESDTVDLIEKYHKKI